MTSDQEAARSTPVRNNSPRLWLTLGVIIGGIIVGLVSLSTLTEGAREAFEDGDYCRSYETSKKLVLVSEESRLLMAIMYASGFCVDQDIPRAKQLYATMYKGDTGKIGTALFYDAFGLAESDHRSGTAKRSREIQALFAEATALGFRPSEKESTELAKLGLTREFQASSR